MTDHRNKWEWAWTVSVLWLLGSTLISPSGGMFWMSGRATDLFTAGILGALLSTEIVYGIDAYRRHRRRPKDTP